MKVYSIALIRTDTKPTCILAKASELSSFGFFQRSSVQEFMNFFSVTIAERTKSGMRQDVEEKDYVGHVYARNEGIAGVIVTDKEYPGRVAYSLLSKILDEFLQDFPGKDRWTENMPVQTQKLSDYISKYQDPNQADTIMKVQQELDETKEVLKQTIDQVLRRGEKLDDLVARSDDLSAQSRLFYKQAKKTNSCCLIQ
ncbi:Synaptobrevin YKT6 [Neolecta irregularis DAH-3]|uniref:Synaptobrevin homolog YKT6 n=1 Tax=Neolecta irregularis (strain DAH-3) TaxID=1198029 RepID=A0A1U7LPY1_NEOID|nr:Synaptobrevin YKT6 [Neolecta irregularis DAH-3]|eukprot:OLL24643.1 Synaptobrevin YKT6 [Neolecta irregularis DAH-3]